MHRSTLLLASLALLPGLLIGCGRQAGGGAGEEPKAMELDISRVTINQGVEIELMDDGDGGDRNAPVVRERDGLVRIYVERQVDWEDRRIKGVFKLLDDGDVVETFDRELNVSSDSHEGDIDSTINIKVPGESIKGGLEWRATIYEVEGGSGEEGRNEWPEGGGSDLDAEDPGGPLRVVLVPIQYNADGSQRVPDTSDQQLDYYKDWLTRLYPANELDFEVADVLPWGYEISPFGQGWGDILNYMINYRDSHNFDDDVYVYGIFNPASSYSGYCGQGCIAGLSLLASSPNEAWMRVSIGVGFTGEQVALTMAHEVGHAHGRGHAPCQVDDGIDYDYPYDNAYLGVAGWDILDEELIEEDHAFDVMSYCDPNWISDYNYEALFDRMQHISGEAHVVGAESSSWTRVMVDGDGHLAPGGKLDLMLPPQGELRSADLLDAHGQLVERVDARFFEYSHIDGGMLLVPTAAGDATTLRLGDATLDL